MKKFRMLVFLGLLPLSLIVAHAQQTQAPLVDTRFLFFTGTRLHEVCKHYGSEEKFVQGEERDRIISDNGVCRGFILGSVQGVPTLCESCTGEKGSWSPPKDLGTEQVIAVVRKYFDNHPELWDRPALELIEKALVEAFPPAH